MDKKYRILLSCVRCGSPSGRSRRSRAVPAPAARRARTWRPRELRGVTHDGQSESLGDHPSDLTQRRTGLLCLPPEPSTVSGDLSRTSPLWSCDLIGAWLEAP